MACRASAKSGHTLRTAKRSHCIVSVGTGPGPSTSKGMLATRRHSSEPDTFTDTSNLITPGPRNGRPANLITVRCRGALVRSISASMGVWASPLGNRITAWAVPRAGTVQSVRSQSVISSIDSGKIVTPAGGWVGPRICICSRVSNRLMLFVSLSVALLEHNTVQICSINSTSTLYAAARLRVDKPWPSESRRTICSEDDDSAAIRPRRI